jgi:acetolactate synthase-1/2/3 large subunit
MAPTNPPTVAETVAAALAERGVRYGFGIPGGVLLEGIEALRAQGVEFVLVRHEGSAGFMADVCYQLTGAPGLCIGTLGPGVTNLVSPLAGAMLDRSRVLALTAQCSTELLGTYTHQILDQVAVVSPVVETSALVDPADPDSAVHAIFARLDAGTPRPVHLDVPVNAWTRPCSPVTRIAAAPASVDTDVLAQAADALSRAKRPVMVVGIGDLSDVAAVAVTALAHDARIPVLTTYRAKGMLDEHSDWAAGCFGLSPVVDAMQQDFIDGADLLIAVGLDPVELRAQWLPGWRADLPMLAVDPHGQTDICHPAAWDLRGPIPTLLDALRAGAPTGASTWHVEQIAAHCRAWSTPFDDDPHGPADTIRAIQRGLGPDGIVSVDVGAHRITASHVWRCRQPRQMLQSNGFSTMGTGLPGAIAARLVAPDRPVLALCGDAGLWMTLGELGIIQDRALDLVVVYLADEALTLIALKQERQQLADCGVRFTNPDVQSLATAFGGHGVSVAGADAVEEAVRQGIASGGLHLIEARIDPSGYRRQM